MPDNSDHVHHPNPTPLHERQIEWTEKFFKCYEEKKQVSEVSKEYGVPDGLVQKYYEVFTETAKFFEKLDLNLSEQKSDD